MPNEPTEWVYTTQLKLDEDDSKLLDQCATEEKLPKVEILRRALRHFAKHTLPESEESTPEQPVAEATSVAS